MMWEIVGIASLLKSWKVMPDAPPSEYSPWSGDAGKNRPFAPKEIGRMRVALKALSPATHYSVFPEEKLAAKNAAAESGE